MRCNGCGRMDFETVAPDDARDPVIQCRSCHRIFSLRYDWAELISADAHKVIPLFGHR